MLTTAGILTKKRIIYHSTIVATLVTESLAGAV